MRFWNKHREMDFLEARLREERPAADDEFVGRLAAGVPRRRERAPGLRLAAAMALTALLLVPVAALGALTSPLNTARQLVTPNQGATTGGGSTGNVSLGQNANNTSANRQYQETVTICHRDNRGRGTTITVSQQGANNHLQNHPGDTTGPCPPVSGP